MFTGRLKKKMKGIVCGMGNRDPAISYEIAFEVVDVKYSCQTI